MKEIYDDSIGQIIRIPDGEEGINETFEESIENTDSLRDQTLADEGYRYALQIPLDKVTEEEQKILTRYIYEYPYIDTLTSEEKEETYNVIAKYTDAIDKHKPQETLQNYEDNVELVNAYNEFMEMTDQSDMIQNITFEYMMGAKKISILFDVYPLTDSQAILDISTNLSLFKDLTDKEMKVYARKDETLTREEQIIIKSVEEKISRTTTQQAIPIITEFLSMQLRFHDCSNTNEEMKLAIKRIPIVDLVRLYDMVSEVLHLDDTSSIEVFQ